MWFLIQRPATGQDAEKKISGFSAISGTSVLQHFTQDLGAMVEEEEGLSEPEVVDD